MTQREKELYYLICFYLTLKKKSEDDKENDILIENTYEILCYLPENEVKEELSKFNRFIKKLPERVGYLLTGIELAEKIIEIYNQVPIRFFLFVTDKNKPLDNKTFMGKMGLPKYDDNKVSQARNIASSKLIKNIYNL